MWNSKVLFIVSGSISAFKAAQVVSSLAQAGHEVQVVATESALRFVGAATFEGLTGRPVLHDLWAEGRMMDHIHLTRVHERLVICPASADLVARLAHGIANDLATTLALAWPKEKPIDVFPAMNSQMLQHPATQLNLQTLRERGVRVHATGSGSLACGEFGEGRLLEPAEIVAALQAKGRKALITAGATREFIDGIRFVSNVSTGQTGATLADLLSAKGWDVTYLHGVSAQRPRTTTAQIGFTSTRDLDQKLHTHLAGENFDLVIHAAAVSDYTPIKLNGRAVDCQRKQSSELEIMEVAFQRNSKLLPRLKEYSRTKAVRVVGFKLTHNETAEDLWQKARGLLGPGVDAIVANDWSQVEADRHQHPGWWVTSSVDSDKPKAFENLNQLCQEIEKWF